MKKIGIALGCALLLFGMTGCQQVPDDSGPNDSSDGASSKSGSSESVNTDPRKDYVIVQDYRKRVFDGSGYRFIAEPIAKICDKTTLLYITLSSGGVTAIPNSSECQPNPQ